MNKVCTLLAAFLISGSLAPATAGPIWTGEHHDQPALGGNDPLSYFAGKPTAGKPAFSLAWNGANFRFATAANRAAFAANPARYTPRYGGHCAWAASEGRSAGGNPDVWLIADGQLVLNCSKSAEAKWHAGLPGTRERADAWWAAQGK